MNFDFVKTNMGENFGIFVDFEIFVDTFLRFWVFECPYLSLFQQCYFHLQSCTLVIMTKFVSFIPNWLLKKFFIFFLDFRNDVRWNAI